jgi:glucose-6-phosphate 1-dehydrogenase
MRRGQASGIAGLLNIKAIIAEERARLEEEGANTESTTESFVALKVAIDNWRWAGVPFYLRTGKRMKFKRTEIVVNFKQQPHNF